MPGSSTSAASAVRPAGMPRFLAIAVGLAAAGVVIFALKQVADIVNPVFLTVNLMIAAYPLYGWLTARKAPRLLAAILTGLIVLVMLMGFFVALGWAASALITELPQYQGRFQDLYNQIINWLTQFGISQDSINQQLKDINPSSLLGVATNMLSSVGSVLSLLTVCAVLIFFVTLDLMGFRDRLGIIDDLHPRFGQALRGFGRGVRRYWIVTTGFGLLVATIDTVALLFLGVPLALPWGVVAFLSNFIPNIGFVIGLVPPALMALLTNGPTNALIVIIIYSVVNFVIQTLIQPKVSGDAVGVTPTVSFLSLLFWAWVFGAMGALLAMPLTLLVKALIVDADPRSRWANALISSDPDTALAPSPQEATLGTLAKGVPEDLPDHSPAESVETSPKDNRSE